MWMLKPVSCRAALGDYGGQAAELLEAHRAGDEGALTFIHHKHPRFLDEKIRWLPRRLTPEDIRSAAFDQSDAELAIARGYDFRDWAALEEFVDAVRAEDSPVRRFETAVDAVVDGDLVGLQQLLAGHPDLVQARSTRVTHFDPPVHRSMLLHYVAANGVEGYRQKTPPNAVAIARALLEAGAEVDALASLYGGECTTMSLLVSSSHPAEAGLQLELVEVLLDYGASPEGRGTGNWVSPVKTALLFGFRGAAELLVQRGARVEDIGTAAGMGRVEDVRRLYAGSDEAQRHQAITLAAQLGHVEVVRFLLDVGESPDRYNPEGHHAHSTPLHQAALAGHEEVVRLLVERGARRDIRDKIYHGTPLDWANYVGHKEIGEFLGT